MPMAGECIAGRYRLECPLGEGGMGSVWRARHLELDVPVAVKFQHAHHARAKGAEARFRKEARAAARLKSSNVVRVVDFGVDGDVAYLAMEFLDGESLRTRLERQQSSSIEWLGEVVSQAASALDAAHEAGIVHRDIKPSNLFLVPSGAREVVKLLDFGIAKWFGGEVSAEGTLTEDDVVVGSARYMSPEQTRGEPVDPRSDVWSLAVVAYEMLTGVAPFDGANVPDTLRRIGTGRFDMPSRVLSGAYAPFDPVFLRAFELEPACRFETAGDFSVAFNAASREAEGRGDVVPSAPPAGGWAFGRDGATLSVPIEQQGPRVGARRRWVGVLVAVVGVGGGMLFLSPGRGHESTGAVLPPQPRDRSATTAAPTASPNPHATERGSVAETAKATPSVEREPPVAKGRRAKQGGTPKMVSSVQRATPAPRHAPPASSVARPSPAKHVHPVFGLEVQAQR